ncbi:MAG: hypothetical protein EBT33_20125 [Betaproteobacteria bacterium]|nr:hypothetical protein [Betaproteobacteria bacterium]
MQIQRRSGLGHGRCLATAGGPGQEGRVFRQRADLSRQAGVRAAGRRTRGGKRFHAEGRVAGLRRHRRLLSAAGILFAINWALGLATLGTWLIVAIFMRYSSLAALCAAVFAPIYFTFLFGVQPMGLAIVVMSALLIYRHRSNIRNLLNGTETRLSKK